MGTDEQQLSITPRKDSRRRPSLPALTVKLEDAAALQQQLGGGGYGQCSGSPSVALHDDDHEPETDVGPDLKRSRRLTAHQVRLLEHNFSAYSPKLDTNRKLELASQLDMTPRQVAIWFQNRRARCKTKQLESDCGNLRAKIEALRADYAVAVAERDRLLAQVKRLGGHDNHQSAMLSNAEAVAPIMPSPKYSRTLQDHEAAVQLIPATNSAAASTGDGCSATLQYNIPCLSRCSSPRRDDESALVVCGMPVDPRRGPLAPVVDAVAGNDVSVSGLHRPSGGSGVCWQDSTDSSLTSLTCGSSMSTGVQLRTSLWNYADVAAGSSCFHSDIWGIPQLQGDAQPVASCSSSPSGFTFMTTDVPPTTAAGHHHQLPLRDDELLLADCCNRRAVRSASSIHSAQLNFDCLMPLDGVANQDQVVPPWWQWLDDVLK